MSFVSKGEQMDVCWTTKIDWGAVGSVLSSFAAITAIMLGQKNTNRSLDMAEQQLEHARQVQVEAKELISIADDKRNLAAVGAGLRALRASNAMRSSYANANNPEALVPILQADRTGQMLIRHAEKIEAISPIEISPEYGVQLAEIAEFFWMQGDMLHSTDKRPVSYGYVANLLSECERAALGNLTSVLPPIPAAVFVDFCFVDRDFLDVFFRGNSAPDAPTSP